MRLVPVEDAERNAVVRVAEIEEHVAGRARDELMHGMPLVVDQHLRGNLLQAQVGADGQRGDQKT